MNKLKVDELFKEINILMKNKLTQQFSNSEQRFIRNNGIITI